MERESEMEREEERRNDGEKKKKYQKARLRNGESGAGSESMTGQTLIEGCEW